MIRCLASARVIDGGPACSQIHYLNMVRYKRSSALITSKAVLITRHFNTQSILAFVNDLVNLLHFNSAVWQKQLLNIFWERKIWGDLFCMTVAQ